MLRRLFQFLGGSNDSSADRAIQNPSTDHVNQNLQSAPAVEADANAPVLFVDLVNDLKNAGNIAVFNVRIAEEFRERAKQCAIYDNKENLLAETDIADANEVITAGAHMHLVDRGENLLEFRVYDGVNELGSAQISFTNPLKQNDLIDAVTSEMQKFDVPVAFFGLCDSSYYPYKETSQRGWFDQENAKEIVKEWHNAGEIDANYQKKLEGFVDNGFVIFEDLIEPDLLDQINAEIDEAIAEKVDGYEYGSSQRIEHLHFKKAGVRRLFHHEKLQEIASLILEGDARPSQTLTFVFGSQQDAHQDTIHLTPFPAGYMCGIWIALQDIQPGSGELVVYPGSHREDRVYLADTDCKKVTDGDWDDFSKKVGGKWAEIADRYQPEIYRPKKGTVLFWHENLLHAGSPRKTQELERRAIVIHSFSENVVVYYDSLGIPGTVAEPELHLEDH